MCNPDKAITLIGFQDLMETRLEGMEIVMIQLRDLVLGLQHQVQCVSVRVCLCVFVCVCLCVCLCVC